MVKTRPDGRQVRGKRVGNVDNDEAPIPRAHGVGKPAWLEAQAAARGRDRTVPARIKVWQWWLAIIHSILDLAGYEWWEIEGKGDCAFIAVEAGHSIEDTQIASGAKMTGKARETLIRTGVRKPAVELLLTGKCDGRVLLAEEDLERAARAYGVTSERFVSVMRSTFNPWKESWHYIGKGLYAMLAAHGLIKNRVLAVLLESCNPIHYINRRAGTTQTKMIFDSDVLPFADASPCPDFGVEGGAAFIRFANFLMDDDKDASIIEQVGRDTGVTGHFRAWVKKTDAPLLHHAYESVERLVQAAVAAVMDKKPANEFFMDSGYVWLRPQLGDDHGSTSNGGQGGVNPDEDDDPEEATASQEADKAAAVALANSHGPLSPEVVDERAAAYRRQLRASNIGLNAAKRSIASATKALQQKTDEKAKLEAAEDLDQEAIQRIDDELRALEHEAESAEAVRAEESENAKSLAADIEATEALREVSEAEKADARARQEARDERLKTICGEKKGKLKELYERLDGYIEDVGKYLNRLPLEYDIEPATQEDKQSRSNETLKKCIHAKATMASVWNQGSPPPLLPIPFSHAIINITHRVIDRFSTDCQTAPRSSVGTGGRQPRGRGGHIGLPEPAASTEREATGAGVPLRQEQNRRCKLSPAA